MNISTTLAQASYNYEYSTGSTSSELTTGQAEAIGAFFIAFLGLFIILSIASYVIMSLSFMKIFKKAGIEGWAAWVPILNTWKLLEIGGKPGYWAVLALIPVVNIVSAVFMYISMYNIGLKLQKSGAFVVLAIFLPYVWAIWLAFDKSTWNESAGEPSLAAPVAPTPTAPTAPTV